MNNFATISLIINLNLNVILVFIHKKKKDVSFRIYIDACTSFILELGRISWFEVFIALYQA